MRFDDCVIVITGVGRKGQVGEAVAQAFAGRGAALVLVERSEQRARERAGELGAGAARAVALGADLADPSAAHEMAASLSATIGPRIDALVHLAGGFAMSGPVADSAPDDWERMLAINLRTAVNTTRVLLPALRKARGAIVYFASEAVLPGSRTAEMGAYAAAKSGVVALMRAVALEERAHGVRANALAPGTIRTAENVASMGPDARFVERDAVADAVIWLCGTGARGVTGQVIQLSAGPG